MSDVFSADAAAQVIRERSGVDSVDIACVLGSGWVTAVDQLDAVVARIPLAEIPGFRSPVVAGHGGNLVVCTTPTGKTALIFTGRTHLYEGRGVHAVAHGVRTSAALGASTLMLTNGCGSVRADWGPGTIAVISDHVNLSGTTPLSGPDFVDLSCAYSPRLRELAHHVDPDLADGVYCQLPGPSYETPAEVRMLRILGADLVGMSTVVETITARSLGLDVLALSLVTNLAAGLGGELSHAEVLAAGTAATPRLQAIVSGILGSL